MLYSTPVFIIRCVCCRPNRHNFILKFTLRSTWIGDYFCLDVLSSALSFRKEPESHILAPHSERYYAWSDLTGKREMVWTCDRSKEVKDGLLAVSIFAGLGSMASERV